MDFETGKISNWCPAMLLRYVNCFLILEYHYHAFCNRKTHQQISFVPLFVDPIAGPLTCAECPLFDTRVVKWPILERRSLSLKKQKELRRWMVDEAIQSAEHLIAGSGSSSAPMIGNTGNFGWNPMKSLAWTGPSKAEFLGDSSNSDKNEL